MTAEAARDLGIEIVVLERAADSPAGQIVGAKNELVGDWRDPAAREALAARVDLVTLENEFVDAAALQWLVDRGIPVYPGPEALRLIQDKLTQKETLRAAGLPVPRFVPVQSIGDLGEAGARLGWPLVLKARRLGYDGHGNVNVADPDQAAAAIARLVGQPPAGGPEPSLDLFAEAFVAFKGELAVMVARGRDGATAVYPAVETYQREHICHEVVAPARIDERLAARAREIALQAVEAVEAVGVVGVELFYTANGEVSINELAPRPHNSGHYTIEACQTSQFANHLRAVLGWPLGSTELVTRAAAMVNLLGTTVGPAKPCGLADATVPGAFVHLYGKREVRPRRKMGHVTALGDSPEGALATAHAAASAIRWYVHPPVDKEDERE
jgi:5-(carboxyamino)imidazole ribonucleotide synthase